MKHSSLIVFASFCVCLGGARAADATTPIDYTQRNAPYAPGLAEGPLTKKQQPAVNATVGDKRVEKPVIGKPEAPLAERRAAVDVKETDPKNIREKDSRRPETIARPMSRFNQRTAPFSTSSGTSKPPTVAKYQDSLTAAGAVVVAPLPAMNGKTSAKINRFVFRKNPTEASASIAPQSAIPAAGGPIAPK